MWSKEEIQKSLTKYYPTEQIVSICNTVAKDATPEELIMFFSICRKWDLDPFAREVWFIKDNRGKTTIITGRDGYLSIANRNHHYKGMKSDVVYENDEFIKEDDNIKHTYNLKDRGKMLGAYALVYRDDRAPTFCYAPFTEYNKPESKAWRQYPNAMIKKVAEAMALKRAFSISGLVTYEEIGMTTGQCINADRSIGDVETDTLPRRNTSDIRADFYHYWSSHDELYEEFMKCMLGDDYDNYKWSKEHYDQMESLLEDIEKICANPVNQIFPIPEKKIAMWRAYCKLFNGNQETARAEIEKIIGVKPSSKWTTQDIVHGRLYLAQLEKLGEALNETDNQTA